MDSNNENECKSNSDSENETNRPITPKEEDCCHNACEPCIFDVHKSLVEEYERKIKYKIKIEKCRNTLNQTSHKPFKVSNIEKISDNYILLALADPEKSWNDTRILIKPGQYVMLHAWGITRPFTPIEWTKKSIIFLVKLYLHGRFTTLLRELKIGDKINIRGPYGDFVYKRNSFQRVIMFSMGSGIAPHYAITTAIVNDDLEETKVHIVGGFREISEIPLKKQLQALSDYWNCECTLHISQPLGQINPPHGINIKVGRLDQNGVMKILENILPHVTLVLICGTEEFNELVGKSTANAGFSNI